MPVDLKESFMLYSGRPSFTITRGPPSVALVEVVVWWWEVVAMVEVVVAMVVVVQDGVVGQWWRFWLVD